MPGACRTRKQGVLPLCPKSVDSARSTPPELSRDLNARDLQKRCTTYEVGPVQSSVRSRVAGGGLQSDLAGSTSCKVAVTIT
jgi:hypothetical protein